MHVNVAIYAISAVLNVITCATVHLSKGFTTVNMFVLHIMFPSAINSILLCIFGVFKNDENVFQKIYRLVDIYVSYHYAVVGGFFHLFTYLLFVKPMLASKVIDAPKKWFYISQAVALFFTLVSYCAVQYTRGYLQAPEVMVLRRAINLAFFNLPCMLLIMLLFVTYFMSICKIVQYKAKSFQSTKIRKSKTAVLFFTPIILLFLGNLADFGITNLNTLFLFFGSNAFMSVRSQFDSASSYFYPAQMIIYPVCTLIAFPEYRRPLTRWNWSSSSRTSTS